MKRTVLLFLLLATVGMAVAQQRVVATRSQDGKSVDFVLEEKQHPGIVTVLLNFKELVNSDESIGVHKYRVQHDGTPFLTLRPSDDSRGVGYSYSYRCLDFVLDAKVDSSFVYRMPCSTRKSVEVIRTVSAYEKYIKKSKSLQQMGFSFALEKGDTVYAMRRGVVTEIETPAERVSKPGVEFTSRIATISVQQPDGTIGWYLSVDPEHLLVEVGDEVWPSTPLALVGTRDGVHYSASVQVYWFETNEGPDASWEEDYFVVRRYIPRFATTDGVLQPDSGMSYTPVMTPEIYTREMTKKELKKYASDKSGGRKH